IDAEGAQDQNNDQRLQPPCVAALSPRGADKPPGSASIRSHVQSRVDSTPAPRLMTTPSRYAGGMSRAPRINRVAVHRFGYQVSDLGVDYNGFNHVYEAGSCQDHSGYVLSIGTDVGITGEYVGGNSASYAQVGMFAKYLLGK